MDLLQPERVFPALLLLMEVTEARERMPTAGLLVRVVVVRLQEVLAVMHRDVPQDLEVLWELIRVVTAEKPHRAVPAVLVVLVLQV